MRLYTPGTPYTVLLFAMAEWIEERWELIPTQEELEPLNYALDNLYRYEVEIEIAPSEFKTFWFRIRVHALSDGRSYIRKLLSGNWYWVEE